MFSSTTMASSTTKPSARVRASRLTLSSENPNIAMPANVPMIDSGRGPGGAKVARQLLKKARGRPRPRGRQDIELVLRADAADRGHLGDRRHRLPDLLHRDAARGQRI